MDARRRGRGPLTPPDRTLCTYSILPGEGVTHSARVAVQQMTGQWPKWDSNPSLHGGLEPDLRLADPSVAPGTTSHHEWPWGPETFPYVTELGSHTHCVSGAGPGLHSRQARYPDDAPPPRQSAGLRPRGQGDQRTMVTEGRPQPLGSLQKGSSGAVGTGPEGRDRWDAG